MLGDSGVLTVIANAGEAHRQGVKVYNLEVEQAHTYFVLAEHAPDGADAVWVHNAKYGEDAARALLKGAGTPGFTPIQGSGGPGKVYLMSATRLKSGKPYVGGTRRPVAKRMSDADHRAKTVDGAAPDSTLVADNLSMDERRGIEGILVDIGGTTLSNAQKALRVNLPKNAVRVKAGDALITKWHQG
ncbi:hypothetical protein [Humisphaera borealis]|uniref:hypothetical protein n=1 Tax=Humisphaera borealis TaxID=2807512 RepID=UPI0036F28D47